MVEELRGWRERVKKLKERQERAQDTRQDQQKKIQEIEEENQKYHTELQEIKQKKGVQDEEKPAQEKNEEEEKQMRKDFLAEEEQKRQELLAMEKQLKKLEKESEALKADLTGKEREFRMAQSKFNQAKRGLKHKQLMPIQSLSKANLKEHTA